MHELINIDKEVAEELKSLKKKHNKSSLSELLREMINAYSHAKKELEEKDWFESAASIE